MRSTRARAGARRNGRSTAQRCVRTSDLRAEYWGVYQHVRRQGDLHSQYVARMRANPADIEEVFPYLPPNELGRNLGAWVGRHGKSAEPMTTARRLEIYCNDGRKQPSRRQGRQLERMYQRECWRDAEANA